ncbi:MAG: hypothetical protein IH934_03080 [Nanoarchaeota archaeon]|nr:hypothetical protein [Nanoarchaeota archaeon]
MPTKQDLSVDAIVSIARIDAAVRNSIPDAIPETSYSAAIAVFYSLVQPGIALSIDQTSPDGRMDQLMLSTTSTKGEELGGQHYFGIYFYLAHEISEHTREPFSQDEELVIMKNLDLSSQTIGELATKVYQQMERQINPSETVTDL